MLRSLISITSGILASVCVILAKLSDVCAKQPDVKKPHTIAEELILPAAIEIVETMFGDNFAKELQSISLSNDTVSRRIDDIAEDVEQQLFEFLDDWNVNVTSWKYPKNLELPSVISRVWQRFQDDGNVKRCYSTVRPRFTTPNEVRYVAVIAKRNRRSTASDLPRQLSSRQTVYRRLGYIGLYARRPVRCVPLTATHFSLRLTWSREHAL
ncbi:HTH_Tnp_Tc3_2 domain-containing protein [Trichonephila clavipes]|nr:HTH_Tnp_Tc3_2 domain-containing protein [Trichonephila clavipes]